MTASYRLVERPTLERPVLIAAFRGWNDGGQGASLAARYLARPGTAERFATIDPENFYDFQATRPHGLARRRDDAPDRLAREQPSMHAPLPGLGRDAIILLGVEPNLRWRTFSSSIVELAQDLGVELVVTLGVAARRRAAHAARAGHRQRDRPGARRGARPRSRRATRARPASSASSTTRAGGRASPSASLWAAVPHYVSLDAEPAGRARRSASGSASCSATDVDLAELDEAADAYGEQVSEAVAADAETAAVRRGARAARRRARATSRGPPVRRLARRRADALPARARRGRGRRRERGRPGG